MVALVQKVFLTSTLTPLIPESDISLLVVSCTFTPFMCRGGEIRNDCASGIRIAIGLDWKGWCLGAHQGVRSPILGKLIAHQAAES